MSKQSANLFGWRPWPWPPPKPPPPAPVTLESVARQLAAVLTNQGDILARLERMEKLGMASQADIDQITQNVQSLIAAQDTLSGHVDAVDQALKDFIARNPGVDVSALQQAVARAQSSDDAIDQHVQAIQNVIPAAPTPAPAPAPAPSP